jgi:hypothetical protein
MRRFSYSPFWLARSLVGLARHPEWPSSRGRDRPGLLLETPCRVPLRALMSGMLTLLLLYVWLLLDKSPVLGATWLVCSSTRG